MTVQTQTVNNRYGTVGNVELIMKSEKTKKQRERGLCKSRTRTEKRETRNRKGTINE